MSDKPSVLERIKNNFSKPKDNIDKNPHTPEEQKKDFHFDTTRLKEVCKKYWWVILLLIPLVLSTYLRIQPAYLPITDDWARDTVHNGIRQQLGAQAQQQYPNLPPANLNQVIDEQFNDFVTQNSEQIDAQISQVSSQFKSQLQDEDGQTYLLAIDPYFYLRHVENYLANGISGTEELGPSDDTTHLQYRYPQVDFSETQVWDSERLAPLGAPSAMTFHSYFGVFTYRVMHFFNPSTTPLQAMFFLPAILAALATIPAFFITRRMTNNFGGFVAALLIAYHSSFLSRTMAGFSDTDAYNVLFPLLIVWTILLAYDAKNIYKRLAYGTLSGLFIGLFAFAWTGWWYIFNLALGAIVVATAYSVFVAIRSKEYTQLKAQCTPLVSFLISSGIFVTIFKSADFFFQGFTKPLNVSGSLKAVAVSTVWPNIRTTVAELNSASIDTIIANMGGTLFFGLAILGVLLLAYQFTKDKDKPLAAYFTVLLAAWLIGMTYASTQGIRFTLLLLPGFALAIGAAIGLLLDELAVISKKQLQISPIFTKVVILVAVIALFASPVNSAITTSTVHVPSMNDAWYTALTKIDQQSQPDAIINSWWDFGHWFITVANRQVTFDGAGQDEYMAHWIGKTLLTADQDTAVGILRMVDCGSNNAYEVLNKELDNPLESISILNQIISQNKTKASSTLIERVPSEVAQETLRYTHCDPPENYFITSQDMVGKAGVWGHFGSWNFTRAEMYKTVRGTDPSEGKNKLQESYGLDESTADAFYNQIHTQEADQWISPWPGYASGVNRCTLDSTGLLICPQSIQGQQVAFEVNLSNQSAVLSGTTTRPNTLVIPTETDTIEVGQDGDLMGLSLTLIPNANGYTSIVTSPLQANSMFTRLFFMEGHGLNHFNKFDDRRGITGNRIITWKVNWEGVKSEVSAGDKVGVHYIGSFVNETLFDSSIVNWNSLDVTPSSSFEDFESSTFSFVAGSGQVIPGFDNAVLGASVGDIITTTIPAQDAYGVDPAAHPLGNKTLVFKIQIVSID